ncbi:hypothetical protein [Pseudarthrobacter sp. NS4]|uniref:hypothetical protein n=1 Tax=Pseudarthrobacter sp. NS4 TaxID=2973976 RepID=UPI002163599C|nr:hypothetical protein [Pseudarthrobacter sp. NS4]
MIGPDGAGGVGSCEGDGGAGGVAVAGAEGTALGVVAGRFPLAGALALGVGVATTVAVVAACEATTGKPKRLLTVNAARPIRNAVTFFGAALPTMI